MSLRYKRFLKETYSISKIGIEKKKLDSNDDSIATHELIERIDNDLKHLHGQKRILQNAKDGKTFNYKITSNEKSKTNNKNQKKCLHKCNSKCNNISCKHLCNILLQNKTIKVKDSCTQIGSSLKNGDNGLHNCKNHKIFSSKKPSAKSRQKSPGLECSTWEEQNCVTKMEEGSKRPEKSYESHTYQNIDNNITKSLPNSKPKSMVGTQSPRNDRHTDQHFISSPRSTKTDGQFLGRTESLIRRQLSREILEYARKRAKKKINELKSHKKKKLDKGLSLKNFDRSLHKSQNEISETYHEFNLLKEMPKNDKKDERKSLNDKRELRKDSYKISKFENNNLTETSHSSKSYEVPKRNVIDDTTYTCPDNSVENDYLLIPYVGNTSNDNDTFNLSPKPTKQFEDNSMSFFVLEDVSSQQTSKLSDSVERKLRTNQAIPEQQFKKNFSTHNSVNQRKDQEEYFSRKSDKSHYMNHNLESTWESHDNREGPLVSKFDMPHEINIPTFYRSHNSNLKDQPVQSFSKGSSLYKNKTTLLSSDLNGNSIQIKDISEPLRSDQYDPKHFNPTKLVSQMEKGKLTNIYDKNNNKATTWNLCQNRNTNRAFPSNHSSEDNLSSTQSYLKHDQIYNQTFSIEPEKLDLRNTLFNSKMKKTTGYETQNSVSSLQNEKPRKSSEIGYTKGEEIFVKTSTVKQKEKCKGNLDENAFKVSALKSLTKQVPELGAISKSYTETPKLTIPQRMETIVNVNDTRQDNILKPDIFETIASSKESGSIVTKTPQKELNYSDNEIQDQALKQRSIQINDLKSKSSSFKFDADSKEKRDQPRSRQSENYLRHSIPEQLEKQFNRKTSIVSRNNETAQISINDSEFGAIPKINLNGTDLHSAISAKIKEYATDLSLKKKTNASNESDSSLEKNISQNNQSDTRKSESNCLLHNPELGAISSSNEIVLKSINKSFLLPKENETRDISQKSSKKIKDLKRDSSPIFQPEGKFNEATLKSNQAVSLKSESNYNVGEVVPQSSIISGLDSFAEINKFTNGKDFKLKSKLLNSLSISSVSSLPQCKKCENQDFSQKSSRSEPKMFNTCDGISLQFQPEQPSEIDHQSDGKRKLISKDIAAVKCSKIFHSTLDGSGLNGSMLDAIPKLSANENMSSISLSDLQKKVKTPKMSQSSTHNYPELNISTGMSSTLEGLSEQKSLQGNHSTDEIPESPKTLSSQQSLPKINKSSASQYLELFWNDNDAKNSFRTSPSKSKQKSNSSRSSKSFHDLNYQKPVKKLQGISSSPVFNANKLDGNDVSNRSLISTQRLESTNTKPTRTDSNMSLKFPQPEEERPSVSFNIQMSNNQIENELNENFCENSSLSLENVKVKHESSAFLSDTLNQNVVLEGVPREVSDLIQHLQSRVKDCDENVKNQFKELEKLKENCKSVEDEEKKTINIRQNENNRNDELMASLNREDTTKNDIKEDISCHCIFCTKEQSTSDCSEEIPSFTGCECMKENYYEIMRIAYDK